jgi:hypothetical protein
VGKVVEGRDVRQARAVQRSLGSSMTTGMESCCAPCHNRFPSPSYQVISSRGLGQREHGGVPDGSRSRSRVPIPIRV